MNAADSARLSLAKRAYQAAQPSPLEVQTGVRRARLALRPLKARRKWLIKGLVFVVLALGSLAYAKPHALAELIERGRALPRDMAGQQRVALAKPNEAPKPLAVEAAQAVEAPRRSLAPDDHATHVDGTAPPKALVSPRAAEGRPTTLTSPQARPEGAKRTRDAAAVGSAGRDATGVEPPPTTVPEEASVTDWGRVGRALARGDEASALSALGRLSQSSEPRTRDKADLGRAQLMMARGNREQGCTLARSLTRRRAGGHIERQALMLLKGCPR